jgi:hypothetical protein
MKKFGMCYGQLESVGRFSVFNRHLVFLVVWYIFPRFVILCQEKSGNPGARQGVLYSFLQ